jgi:hypothetical protein
MVATAAAPHHAFDMRRLAAALGALTLLCGCASSGDTWTKAGVTEQEQGRDTSDCLLQARRTMAGRSGPVSTVDQTRYQDCMANRGYTLGQGTR